MKTLLLLILLVKCLASSHADPLVMTPKGAIRGMVANDGDYDVFLSVPYAVVDEENPFGDALPHPGFDTPFDATKDSPLCPQPGATAPTDLACLILNIYVPHTATSSSKLPVMFYLPGGAFVRNNAQMQNLGPKFLVRHDIIVVTVQHRVGIYGYLCLDIPGYNNQGIKDQILALKWIKDNIESFGGDSGQVTAFGNSAGAMSLDIHLLTKEILFHRLIMQSGAVLSPWVIGKMNNAIPINIAKEFGFVTSDVGQAMNHLKTVNVPDVVRVANNLGITDHSWHPLTKPCVEKPSDTALISEYPIKLKPNVKNIDIMIGTAVREVAFKYPSTRESFYENYKFNEELDQEFGEGLDEDYVKHFYIGDKEANIDVKDEILDFASDMAFVYPVERSIKRYLEEDAKSVYWYLFAYEGGRNRASIRLNGTSGASTHGDDTSYVWNVDTFPETPTPEDQNIIDVITTMWTNFAKFGNPTPTGPTELIPLTWEKVEDGKRPYLVINDKLSLEARPFTKRLAFLDVYYKHHSDRMKGVNSGAGRIRDTGFIVVFLLTLVNFCRFGY